ncbi:MAG TPA: hypothetical protein VGI43_12390 [Mucilaginibacter sp.]|jgi:hypothetical protein
MSSIKEKFILLDALSSIDNFDAPIRLYQHSILNCIDLSDLIRLYSYRDCPHRKLLSYNISRRIIFAHNKAELFDFLFDKIQNSGYVMRLRLRLLLDTIAEGTDDERKMVYFNHFITSRYTHEKNAAIRFTVHIWSEEIEKLLIKQYENQLDYSILKILVLKKSWKSLEGIMEFTWGKTEDKYYKSFFIKHFQYFKFKSLLFLKEIDSANFLNALIKHHKKVSDDQASSLLSTSNVDDKPFTIWRLSNLNKWHIIENEIIEFIETLTVKSINKNEMKLP